MDSRNEKDNFHRCGDAFPDIKTKELRHLPQWATEVLRHFAILEYLRPISPLNVPHDSTPSPQTMLDFMFLELAFFLNNIEKGEGVWVSM